MKHLIALSAITLALTTVPNALAQSTPPALPALTTQQSQDVQARVAAYRDVTHARVARGEITADEAARLLQWREWQLATQAAAGARARDNADAVPPDYREQQPPEYYVIEPAPVYEPWYRYAAPYPYYRYAAPYYWGPRPYAYWGPSICAGGFGRSFGGSICF